MYGSLTKYCCFSWWLLQHLLKEFIWCPFLHFFPANITIITLWGPWSPTKYLLSQLPWTLEESSDTNVANETSAKVFWRVVGKHLLSWWKRTRSDCYHAQSIPLSSLSMDVVISVEDVILQPSDHKIEEQRFKS